MSVSLPRLGLVAAARFREWVQDNPGGVISLPTGRTPEHFIGHVARLLAGWEEREVQAELEELGVNVARGKPDMHSLTFVQVEEEEDEEEEEERRRALTSFCSSSSSPSSSSDGRILPY